MRLNQVNFPSIFLGTFLALVGCGESSEQDNPDKSESLPVKAERVTSIEGIAVNQKITLGDTVLIKVHTDDIVVDSVFADLGGKVFANTGDELEIPISEVQLGSNLITVQVRVTDNLEKHSFPIEVLSDIIPIEYTYQRVAEYRHDPGAYTQGLFYYNGFLYENTGRNGESDLRKVELSTGTLLDRTFLADQYFGEGITLWKDQIIQLTWKSKQGFVYKVDGFEQIKSFNYPTDGWGITTVEDELVMTTHTEFLHFLDPETLLETRRIAVYDNKEKIDSLNEMEYIDGSIYANIYPTDRIVIIDPKTGKVTGNVDFTDLLDVETNRPVNVLNGIAYDEAAKRLFVTGKWWPRLYEVRLLEKNPS